MGTQKELPVVESLAISRKVNRFAALWDEAKLLEKEIEELKDEFKALGECIVASSTLQIRVRESSRHTLDKDAVTQKLGSNWVKAHTNETKFLQMGSPTRRSVRKTA